VDRGVNPAGIQPHTANLGTTIHDEGGPRTPPNWQGVPRKWQGVPRKWQGVEKARYWVRPDRRISRTVSNSV
jgi:hypothetical protein